MVTEITGGSLKIGDLHTKLLADEPQKMIQQKIREIVCAIQFAEYADCKCCGATLDMSDSPDKILSKSGISASTIGLGSFIDLARSWFGLDGFPSANIHIIFPVYATIRAIQYQGGSEITALITMDQQLFADSKVWLVRKGRDDRAPILERAEYELRSCKHEIRNESVYITLRHSFLRMDQSDRILVSLLHKDLGLLDKQTETIYQRPSRESDPVQQAFDLFDAGKKMETHLLNPHDDKDFEASVSWLLEMIGFETFRLGQDEIVRENNTEKGSADIIVDERSREYEGCRLLVVDCTMRVPRADKVDKIRNTADYISRKITFPVRAVIVTADRAPVMKQQADRLGVKIIDSADLERMIGFLKRGHDYPARQIILG